MNSAGIPVIGLGMASPDYAKLPLQWMPHIQVADVAASVNRALELGGTVLIQSTDEDPAKQWAGVTDPAGAAFGLIPVVAPDSIPPPEEEVQPAGRIAWLDLTVENADILREFYGSVVGWSVQSVAMSDGDDRYADYSMLTEEGIAAAGVCHARGGNQGLPPVWLLYLPVGDLVESLKRVREEGGTVLKESATDSGHGYAVIRDPLGVSLALVPG